MQDFIADVEENRSHFSLARHSFQEDGEWFERDLLTGTRRPYRDPRMGEECDTPDPPETQPASEQPVHMDGASLFEL